jgi:cytosine/adenosine deaminase-related metal-dependent hydrolase
MFPRSLVVLATLLVAVPVDAQSPAPTLAIVRANVVDGVTDTRILNATIVVRDGRIVSIRAGGAAPTGATVIDAAGRWVAPGMIDVHTHIASLASARRAIDAGVTTVRSASVPAFQDVVMRDEARDGQIIAPDILATGVFVTPA